jgi:hypothetical protein
MATAEPIKPVSGPYLKPENVRGAAIIAARTHVNGVTAVNRPGVSGGSIS